MIVVFGSRRLSKLISLILVPVRLQLRWLGDDMAVLKQQVERMSTAQDQVSADLATIGNQVAIMAANYNAAAAASLAQQMSAAKAAWEADDDAKWQAAHAETQSILAAMTAGQPITPPATTQDPAPAAVPAPSAPTSGTTTAPAAAMTTPAA